MPSIVLNSFLRSSIRMEKAANVEADRLADLNTRGEINGKEAKSIALKASADRLTTEISEIEFELSKANKALGALDASLSALDQMRSIVDRVKSLEKAAAAETDSTKSTALMDQASDLKEQVAKIGQSATFQGINLFSNWDTQTINIGDRAFTLQGIDMSDVAAGFAYRGGNILGIENGDFDTSAYSKLIAAFGPDTTNNVYSDFTGNLPDGSMVNGAAIAQNGPNGAYSVELAGGTDRATGAHVQLPTMDIPQEVTIGLWGRYDNNNAVNGRFFDFSNTPGTFVDGLTLTRRGTSQGVTFWADLNQVASPGSEIVDGQWQYWMVTVNAAGDQSIYKDGNHIITQNLGYTPVAGSRNNNFLGAAWTPGGATMAGGVADFVMFEEAMDSGQISDWYDSVALTGLENSFFSMSAEKLDAALDKIEASLTTQQIGIQATHDQLAFKSKLHSDGISNLLAIDTESIAVQSNLAQTRQTLAITGLSIMSSSQNNILNLFN